MGNLTFNGVSTDSLALGVVIQTPPVYEFPSRRMDTIQIQGRNGDLIIDKNSFNNVNREYNIAAALGTSVDAFIQKARSIVDWLSSVNGYAILEDSYEPLYFRLAMFRSGGQLPNFYDKATAMIVKFECKPQRFLKTGTYKQTIPFDGFFHEITINETGEDPKTNDTKYIALPMIETFGGWDKIEIRNGEDYNNPDSSTIITMVDDNLQNQSEVALRIFIDSELQDAYTTTEFVNNKINITNGFPKLNPGKNWIKVTKSTSYATSVKIKPRWWVL